jgi:hypothetical protein
MLRETPTSAADAVVEKDARAIATVIRKRFIMTPFIMTM